VKPEVASVLQIADLKMETAAHRVTRAGGPIDLTLREFEVLEYLLLNRGTVVSRELLARDVWKTPMRYSTLDNVIDVHIARIRKKIDDPYEVKLLHTVRGVGFVLRSGDEG
jgi:DNA-binding response OmpR family regulator